MRESLVATAETVAVKAKGKEKERAMGAASANAAKAKAREKAAVAENQKVERDLGVELAVMKFWHPAPIHCKLE